MRKIFLVNINRGSGKCYDEVVYLLKANDIEDAKEKVKLHMQKYYNTGGWRCGIGDVQFDVEDFSCIFERYS
jgi:hypothetical protein